MKIKEHFGELLFTVFILGFLIVGCILNLGVLQKPWERFTEETIDFEEWIGEVKKSYVDEVAFKESFLNLNGLFAKLTGRTVYNDVSVLNNGMLTYGEMPKLNMSAMANGVSEFDTFLEANGISFLYLQAPLKEDLAGSLLPFGVEHCGNENANELLASLKQNKVDTLDLRQSISATPELVEQYFYRTDHHWNTHGAFKAFGETLAYLQTAFPDQEFDTTLADASNWEQTVYEDWFLGSRGKRVGEYFGGVDDLVIYTPKFKTDMSFYLPKYRTYYSGSFSDAVIRSDFLDTPDHFNENAYCAYIGGDYPLVHHVNRLAKNDLKVLLIKDSFSLPFQSFLSTAVRELDVLDPRHYKDSTVAEYIAASKPDIVIMMTNPSVFGDTVYHQFGVSRGEEHTAQTELVSVAFEEQVALEAPTGKPHWNHVLEKGLLYNTQYTLRFERAVVQKGTPDAVTVLLYDATAKKVLGSYVFDIGVPGEWSFVTPQSGSNDLQVLIYCGRHGSTAGNAVTYHNVELYQHQAPKES